MTSGISDNVLSRLNEFLASQMGLEFPEKRWRELERGINAAAREFGFEDTESCIRWLMSSQLTKSRIEILANHLTVGETYFFRDKNFFEVLEKHVLPELIFSRGRNGQRLRIWSAGCSTGEEPYSIAILLDKMIYNLKDWHVTIIGTDINSNFIRKALEGVYSEWSFRDTPAWVKERFFKRPKEGCFEVLPHIKKMVQFFYLNLAEDSYPSLMNNTSAMDIIFCRNVLMYFSSEHKKKVIQRLFSSLAAGGWLFTSPAETAPALFSKFVMLNINGAVLYKKDGVKSLKQQTFTSGLELQPECLEIVRTDLSEKNAVQPADDRSLHNDSTPGELRHSDNTMAKLARVCADQGKLAEAREWCEKAIIADKLNPSLYYLLSIILQEQDQVEEAILSLKRALYLDQNFVLAHFALGNLALRQGNDYDSEKYFGNALMLLDGYDKEDILPESEGITAGRLAEIIAVILEGRLHNEKRQAGVRASSEWTGGRGENGENSLE